MFIRFSSPSAWGRGVQIPATAAESEERSEEMFQNCREPTVVEGGEILATGYVVGILPVGS